MFSNFNEEVRMILIKAKIEREELKHPYIGTEHLLLSILKNSEYLSKKLLKYNITYNSFKKEIIKIVGIGSKETKFSLYTPLLKKIIENAMLDAKDNNNGNVTVEHLLASLIEEGEGIAIRILVGMDIDLDNLYEEFTTPLIKKRKIENKELLIDSIGTNLIEKAKQGKIDPVIARDNEINKLIEILSRRCKNNPLLIGEAGVGKTAIIEYLAYKIYKKDIPKCLENKRIYSLDMASMVSGTKYRGEFEEKMQRLIKEIEEDENIIIFIDEIHTLVGAGGAEGAIDASNILKPSLARGNIKIIGATTRDEYKKYIENDKALSRRFICINIEEPNIETTINILKKLKPLYENYHNVIVPDNVISLIVNLSTKYIKTNHNPDLSIDILDEVSSKVNISNNKENKELKSLKEKLDELSKEKNALIVDGNMKKAYEYLKEEDKLTKKINRINNKQKQEKNIITPLDVANTLKEKIGFQVYEINKDIDNLKKYEIELKNKIVGQDNAIDTLIKATQKIRLGLSNKKVPSFLFIGPTGVGKTELAKEYANIIYGNDKIIRLDMGEFADSTSINKIIGSSAGYIGYNDNNSILNKIKDNPNSIILFDEIDKAHPKVINLLYNILDEGIIKDNTNNIVDITNNIIILTSNIGYNTKTIGFNNKVNKLEINASLPTPLINRIDYIINFNYLTHDNIKQIIENIIDKLKEKYQDLVLSNNIIEELIKLSEYNIYGARRVNKIIETKVENDIIDKILNNENLYISTLKE